MLAVCFPRNWVENLVMGLVPTDRVLSTLRRLIESAKVKSVKRIVGRIVYFNDICNEREKVTVLLSEQMSTSYCEYTFADFYINR